MTSSTMQKPRIFAAFQTKTSQLTLNLNKKHESMVFVTLSQKCYQKTRTKNIGKRKHRNVVLLTKTSQNTGFSCCRPKNLPNINDTPRAAADARATFLLLLLLLLLVLLLLLLLLLVLLLLLAARASAAVRGVSISWLACAETRVLALCSPEIELEFSVCIGYLRCFLAKKCNNRRAALSKIMLSCPFRIVFFGVFLCVSHFASVYCSVFAISRLFAHASFDLHF